jgi:hypothetical protein
MGTRGGMAKNPFGGRPRLDRLEFMDCLEQNAPVEKVIFLQTITDAVHNYLFSFLGRNGTSPEEFAYACQYLFQVRASDPNTWDNLAGKDLSPAQIRDMCFDTHYEFSGLSMKMSMDRFLKNLKSTRREILEENKEQILDYLSILYSRACMEACSGHQLPLLLCDLLEVLVQPQDMREAASLLYLPSKYLQEPNQQKVKHCRTRCPEVLHEVPSTARERNRCRRPSH